jgi:hypothetical protein
MRMVRDDRAARVCMTAFLSDAECCRVVNPRTDTRSLNHHAQLLAHPIYLIRRDMVGTVRQLGKLNGDGNSVARSSKATSDLNGLEPSAAG